MDSIELAEYAETMPLQAWCVNR